ncbi:glycoside hydrolase family 127 protein [Paenibacillus hexagrammi]|uniref:Glycoside hydrolase family 127 protein n=1 Tax=Paenibacillus hexagrammi TaxID=2908839 RepID=A0ABY3SMT9_9BACL|nr:beta-L-arabinofuranosidase domain-containing protein [Paenibacillus sp. YPD9-1]UJF34521.1 glycoside hydrolase family 127 protein [Paenibacillus sp. YPD9-1]
MEKIRIRDDFWDRYTALVRETVIPYQWDALNDRIEDAAPSYAIRNFRIAAGLENGEFGGMVFQDSDLAKWLEAVGYSLASHPDPKLECIADEVIDLVAMAQHENGYINTYFTIKEPGNEWTNLHDCHELYCAGHMMEAAVAYYQGTGKRKLLEVMCKFADHIDTIFGTDEGKLQGYCGHQEIELALVKLFEVTGESRYLKLSQYFIDQRGQEPNYLIAEWERRGRTSYWQEGVTAKPDPRYNQSHLPVREQREAVGHSVRAVYMYTAMADLARLTGDEGLITACRSLWNNVTKKQMYITGGIGSTHHGEAFSFDYDLPNDTIYAETCASIGLIFFAQRMLRLERKSEYADVMERALYNNVIGSMSQDGKHYFYVNPLEVWPEASRNNPGKHHVKSVRQKWFGCSCCPPNVARLLSSLNDYIYLVDQSERTVYVNLYIGSEASFKLSDGGFSIKQQSALPWDGIVSFDIESVPVGSVTLALRLPSWCSGKAELSLNGQPISYEMKDGYAQITNVWQQGDHVEWNLPMQAQWIAAHPFIRANAGKVALQRGPLVYCLEEIDNLSPLSSLSVSPSGKLVELDDRDLLSGAVVIQGEGFASSRADWEEELYRPLSDSNSVKPMNWKAVPYYLWGNRGEGEMSVWLRRAGN